jgi:hypothetical protein
MSNTGTTQNTPDIAADLREAAQEPTTSIRDIDIGNGHIAAAYQDIGERPHQEDFYIVAPLPKGIDSVDIKRVCEMVREDLPHFFSQEELEKSGFVFAIALVEGTRMKPGYLGNTRINAIPYNPTGSFVDFYQTTRDHVATDPDEIRRIRAIPDKGKIIDDQLFSPDVNNMFGAQVTGGYGLTAYPAMRRDIVIGPELDIQMFDDPDDGPARAVVLVDVDGSHMDQQTNERKKVVQDVRREERADIADGDPVPLDPRHVVSAFNKNVFIHTAERKEAILATLPPESATKVLQFLHGEIPPEALELVEERRAVRAIRKLKLDNRTIIATELGPQVPPHYVLVGDATGDYGPKVAAKARELFKHYLSPSLEH